MRMIIAAAICLSVFMQAPAPAYAQQDFYDAQEEAAENPGGGMRTVTPINKCIDQLPEADAIEVRSSYLKPYQECQRRLQTLKRQEAHQGKDAKKGSSKKAAKPAADDEEDEDTAPAAKKAPPPAEDARNFVRVRKDDSPRRPANYGDNAASETPKTPADQGSQRQLYNR